jgi:glycosyl transferase, family 25
MGFIFDYVEMSTEPRLWKNFQLSIFKIIINESSMSSESSLLNLFDKTYIINLPERLDRREEMERQLKKLSLSDKVTFFPAIRPTDKGEFRTIGARGCFLSHLAVLKEAKSQNLNNVLIIEDDLSFSRFLIGQQDKVTDKLRPLKWNFVYLGHGIILDDSQVIAFHEYYEPLILAHFLAIKKNTIDQLVDFLEEILTRPAGHPIAGPMDIDAAYSTFRLQNPSTITLIANPSLGFQRSSSSDVMGLKWFETMPVISQLVMCLRKVKNWYRFLKQ